MCTDCRLEVYRENRADFCDGCKALGKTLRRRELGSCKLHRAHQLISVFDRIIVEHESMRQRLDELEPLPVIGLADDDLIVDLERLEREMLESDPESDLDI